MSTPSFILKKTGLSNYDITSFMDLQNYNINALPVFQEWTDANYVIHRTEVRKRRSGTVKVGFASAAAYSTFITNLSSYLTDGAYSVTAYVNNKGASETFDAYIDTTGAGRWDVVNGRQWLTVELTVEEK